MRWSFCTPISIPNSPGFLVITLLATKAFSVVVTCCLAPALPAVLEMVGLKRATIYKRMKIGTFPKPVQLGSRAVAWDQAVLADWQAKLETGVKKTLV